MHRVLDRGVPVGVSVRACSVGAEKQDAVLSGSAAGGSLKAGRLSAIAIMQPAP